MQVSGNASDKEVLQSNKVFTGLNNFRVISINPSLELIKKNINPNAKDDAANYTGKNQDGADYVRLDFYLTCKEMTTPRKITFFLAKADEKATTGAIKFIDKKGNHTWAKDLETIKSNPKMDWMDKASLRAAYSGEPLLIDFMKAWLNVDTRAEDSVISIEKPESLIKGNVKELKEILEKFKTNQVKLLAIAKETTREDGSKAYYQDFYKKFFGVPYVKSLKKWHDMLEGEYTELKSNQKLQNGLEFTEYIGDQSVAVAAQTSTGSPQAQGGYEDDLPPAEVF